MEAEYEKLKEEEKLLLEQVVLVQDRIKNCAWQQKQDKEERKYYIEILANDMWNGASKATKYESNTWPWSNANKNSNEWCLRHWRTEGKEILDAPQMRIGITKEEMFGFAQCISDVCEDDPEHDDGYESHKFSYNFADGDNVREIIATRHIRSRGGDELEKHVSIDGKDCTIYQKKTKSYTPLRDWPKCTVLAVLWLLGFYEE
jgi:hypothetical protein